MMTWVAGLLKSRLLLKKAYHPFGHGCDCQAGIDADIGRDGRGIDHIKARIIIEFVAAVDGLFLRVGADGTAAKDVRRPISSTPTRYPFSLRRSTATLPPKPEPTGRPRLPLSRCFPNLTPLRWRAGWLQVHVTFSRVCCPSCFYSSGALHLHLISQR